MYFNLHFLKSLMEVFIVQILSLFIIVELKNDKMRILINTLLLVTVKIGHCRIEGRPTTPSLTIQTWGDA